MGKQLGFHIDSRYCSGCKTCQVACKDRADLKVGQLWRRVYMYEDGGWFKVGAAWRSSVASYWVGISCNHCENPKCVDICPTGAMQKREEDGVVMVNTDLCVGCRSCAMACPYDAPQYNPDTGKMGKCDACSDRRAEGKRPVCVDACPFQLITFGPMDELEKTKGGTPWVKGMADPRLTRPSLLINPATGAARSPQEGKGNQ